jgi:dienelactone hydrolase
MQLAGHIATIATGKLWEQLFREKVGDPCEMKSTDYYAFGPTQNPNVAGSVQTCLDDYGNIVTMLLAKGVFKGRRVLSEAAVAEMFRNQTGDVPIRRQPYQPYHEADPRAATWRYGIGCWLEEMDPVTGVATRASSGGAFGCQPFVDFGQGLAGVYLPYCRNMKRGAQGAYNEATVVYLELKPVIAAARPAAKPASAAIGGVEEVRLRDPQRNKELPVRIIHPKAEGKFPVILFSHYAGGSNDEYERLAAHWAGHGYVSLLPDHADSPAVGGQRGPQALQGWRDRALDLRFLLDSLGEIERAVPALRGKLDAGAIGAGGHYIGAHSAGLLAGMKVFGPNGEAETFADPRIKAVLMLSPTGRGQGLTENSWKEMDLPLLVMTGPDDVSRRTGNDAAWRTEPFRLAAPGQKLLVSVKGLDGTYGGLVGKQASQGEIGTHVLTCTLAFWDAFLKKDPEAKAWLESDAPVSSSKGIVKVERR